MPHDSGIKLEDVGYKMKDNGLPVKVDSEKNKIRYPKIRFEEKIPSGAENKKVGDKCKFYGEGEISAISDDEFGKSITLEIHRASIHNSNLSDKEYKTMSDDEKDNADEEEVLGKK